MEPFIVTPSDTSVPPFIPLGHFDVPYPPEFAFNVRQIRPKIKKITMPDISSMIPISHMSSTTVTTYIQPPPPPKKRRKRSKKWMLPRTSHEYYFDFVFSMDFLRTSAFSSPAWNDLPLSM